MRKTTLRDRAHAYVTSGFVPNVVSQRHLEAELFHSRTSNFYQSSNEGKYTGPPDLVLPRFFTILKDNLRYKDIDLLLNIVACQINDSL